VEYYPRKIEEKLDKWINRREAILIKGPRQSGKTTLLLHLKDKFGGEYITFEDENMLRSFEDNPELFAKRFIRGERNILFIDEAQYCSNVGKLLKFLFDSFSDKLKFIVTGSGSFDIKVEVGKYLVGRAIYFELLPLNFEEFLIWKAGDLHKIFTDYKRQVERLILEGEPIESKPVFQREFNTLLEEYILFGGFPAIVKEDDHYFKIELLKNLVRLYIEKDVFFFLNVRELEKFRSIIRYIALSIGSIFEYSSIMREFHVDYRTLENYLSILINTFIVSLIPPFHKNLVTELKKAKKIYFIDTGFRNSIINNFLPLSNRTDKGFLMENFILNELRSFGFEVYYWRTTGKAEVDFIIKVGDEVIPVEVKSGGSIGKSLISFIKSYKPRNAIIFTDGSFKYEEVYGTKIFYLPYFYI